MAAYFNEIDPAAAHILECLIRERIIADGIVDRRSITDIEPNDLVDFKQCHFFAGAGLWSVALRLAGVSDEFECWTGSCPCQPLSVAGKQKGADDERHLWPAFHRLISERKPPVVFGEQVAGKLGLAWFAGVRADLEDAGYACGGANLNATGVGAPHIRQRLYWCAVGDASGHKHSEVREIVPEGSGGGWMLEPSRPDSPSFWSNSESIIGRDGKKRRFKPGVQLLADGVPGQDNLLRVAGNAIVPQLASVFIRSAIEALDARP